MDVGCGMGFAKCRRGEQLLANEFCELALFIKQFFVAACRLQLQIY